MTITRISRLRDCGVFPDFTWPGHLSDFGRYNLIYGWNASGKTTLSRLFRALELRTPPTMGQAVIRIDGKDVRNEGFGQVTIPVRVFNRDFVNESVFPTGGGDVAPIFVVGKESVEKQKKVDAHKAALTGAQNTLNAARSKKQASERAFDGFCIDRAKVIKDTLRSPGSNRYNNYDKADFQSRAQKMVTDGDANAHRLSDSDRDRLLTQHRGTPKPKVQSLTYQLPALQPLTDVVSQLLATTVVTSAIQSLKDDPALSEWTHQGLGLHNERKVKECLFCEQPLPSGRVAALEAHFSAEYGQFMQMLDAQMVQLQAASNEAAGLVPPKQAELYDDLAAQYQAAETVLRNALGTTRQFLDSLIEAMTKKRGQPFECVALDITVPTVDGKAVDCLNEIIGKHNQVCGDFQSRVSAAKKRLEADSVAGHIQDYANLRDPVGALKVAVQAAVDEVGHLKNEIADLEREIVEHSRPAQELNEDLRNYLGHDELRLEIRETGYAITRHGVPAHALSEGETTAIALLYFLKSLQDRRFDLANGVVVLDDPVSSLDQNALFAAFGFIRERTQNARQLIILTHNFTFFRQVRNWFRHLRGQNKRDVNQRPARFYMLECRPDPDQRCAEIRWLDPLLERYESEYHYLFACIYRAATAAPAIHLEQNYSLPNIARRLLEAFLAFRQPQTSGNLWEALQAVQFDEAKKIRILRFLDTHSHGSAVGQPEHDLSVLSEARSILIDLMALIRSQDAEHFSAMVQLASPPEDAEGKEETRDQESDAASPPGSDSFPPHLAASSGLPQAS